MPRNGHGTSGWGLLAADLVLGCFRATSQSTLVDLGFRCQKRIPPPAISQGLGEKGKKVLSKVFPFPSQSQAPGVSGRDLAATGMCGNTEGFRMGLGECKLLRGRSHRGLLCSKLTPKSQSKSTRADNPCPGFAQVRVLLFSNLAQGCAQPPWQGTSAVVLLALQIFLLPGREGVNFSDGKQTEDQTSSLVTSCCWDSSNSPAQAQQFHPSAWRSWRGAAAGRCKGWRGWASCGTCPWFSGSPRGQVWRAMAGCDSPRDGGSTGRVVPVLLSEKGFLKASLS